MLPKNPYKLNTSKYSTHQVIANNLGKNRIILDVGCNDGYIGSMSDNSNTFYGIDYLEASVESAKTIYKDAIVYDLNNLRSLPWQMKFDEIIFADVLEHILYPGTVLNFFVNNYLADNGRVIISLPNIANWQIRICLLFGKFERTETGILDKTHLHFFTFKTAKELVEKNGLTVEEIIGGASFFGRVFKFFPWLKELLATNIILICRK